MNQIVLNLIVILYNFCKIFFKKMKLIRNVCMYTYESFSARVSELTHPELPIYSFEFYYYVCFLVIKKM